MKTDNKRRLRQLLNKSRRLWVIFALAILCLSAWVKLVDWYYYNNFNFLFARRAFFKSAIQRAHWVGTEIARPQILASITLVTVLIVGGVTAPNTQSALYWAMGWGTVFSVFVIYRSAFLIAQRIHIQTHSN